MNHGVLPSIRPNPSIPSHISSTKSPPCDCILKEDSLSQVQAEEPLARDRGCSCSISPSAQRSPFLLRSNRRLPNQIHHDPVSYAFPLWYELPTRDRRCRVQAIDSCRQCIRDEFDLHGKLAGSPELEFWRASLRSVAAQPGLNDLVITIAFSALLLHRILSIRRRQPSVRDPSALDVLA